MNEATNQNEDIKRKIADAGMNGAVQNMTPTFDQKVQTHVIETQAANEVLNALGQVPYALAAPIINLLLTQLRPLVEAPPDD
jgi:hypothetical protein